MEFKVTDTIPYSRERVFRAHRDSLVEFAQYLPNIEEIVVEKREEDGPVVKLVNLWKAAETEVPKVARPFIKPEMLKWTDYATWNENEHKCHWQIELGFLPEAITARGYNEFTEKDGSCTLTIHGEITIRAEKIPGVPRMVAGRLGGTVEKFVVNLIKPNLLKTNEAARRFIEKQDAAG